MARPSITLPSLYLNTRLRPVVSSRTAPRRVENLLVGLNPINYGFERYYKNALSSWGDFPTDTANVTWGYNVDGGSGSR